MKDLLKLLSRIDYGIYEHKLYAVFGVDKSFIDKAVSDGFLERIERGHFYKGIKITSAGGIELARLEAIVPAPSPKTPAQIRLEELKIKLKDNTITAEELKEYLRLRDYGS